MAHHQNSKQSRVEGRRQKVEGRYKVEKVEGNARWESKFIMISLRLRTCLLLKDDDGKLDAMIVLNHGTEM